MNDSIVSISNTNRKSNDREYERHALERSIHYTFKKAFTNWYLWSLASISAKQNLKVEERWKKSDIIHIQLLSLSRALRAWLLFTNRRRSVRANRDISCFKDEKYYFKRWKTLSRKVLRLRLAGFTLLSKRWKSIVANSFGAWYIAFVYEYRLRRASSKLQGNIRRKILWRSLFSWRFLFVRSMYLRHGLRDELDTNCVSLSLEKIMATTRLSRHDALCYYADQVRKRMLGERILYLRTKICRAKFGVMFFRAFRRRDAEILVAITIQRLWRAYSVRGIHHVQRVTYYKRFCNKYYPILCRFLRRKRYRLVFDVLLKFVKISCTRRDTIINDHLTMRAIEILKNRLILMKWTAARRDNIARLHYDYVMRKALWVKLKGLCAMSLAEKATCFFYDGRLCSLAFNKLVWSCKSHARAEIAVTRYDFSVKVKTLHRLRRWSKYVHFKFCQ